MKPEYTHDVSIQRYVIADCGVQIRDTSVMHLSRDYVYDGAVGADGQNAYDISRLFASEALQPYGDGQVSRTLDQQFKVLAQPHPPIVEPSSQCNSPYDCEFYVIAKLVRQRLDDKLFSKWHLFEAVDELSRSGQN